MKELIVWYYQGDVYKRLFRTKLAAEREARLQFPNENPDTRYARIYYRTVED